MIKMCLAVACMEASFSQIQPHVYGYVCMNYNAIAICLHGAVIIINSLAITILHVKLISYKMHIAINISNSLRYLPVTFIQKKLTN